MGRRSHDGIEERRLFPHDHHHHHRPAGYDQATDALRVLAIDVGAGTQDVLVWEGDREPENCPKLVVPSQTQVVGAKVRAATAAGKPIHLTGTLMGVGRRATPSRTTWRRGWG